MKIGVVVDNEYHSDVRVKREVRLLKEFGFEIHVLCLSYCKEYDYTEEGIQITPIYLSRKWKNVLYFFMNTIPLYEWWWAKKVKRFLQSVDVDVLHTHDLYMSKSVKYGIISSGKHKPMVLDLHENYPHAVQSYMWTQGSIRSFLVKPKKWLKKERTYLQYPDRIIVLSDDFKQALLDRYEFLKDHQLVVFPNVVDTEVFDKYKVKKEVSGILPTQPRVLYFGMVAKRRGIFRTLEVCEKLLKQELKFSLVIIGPVDKGDKERLNSFISKPIFDDRLKYIPWVELSELPSYLAACDISLAPFDKNPQHESGIANKLFQYMYGKLPIIASDCKPQQELIERYHIGKVFASDEQFAEQLRFLIENEAVRKQMGDRAHQVLLADFHQDAFKPLLKKLFHELVSDS